MTTNDINIQFLRKSDAQIKFESDNQKHKLFAMFSEFFDEVIIYAENCINISMTVCLAEILCRAAKFGIEYFYFGKRYLPNQRALQIFKRVIATTRTTKFFLVAFLMLVMLSAGIKRRLPVPPAKFLLYMPLYWIFYSVQFSHTHLDYADFVRSRYGLDYGEGMASSFFHGYINLTMPSYRGHPGMRERIEIFEADENVKFVVKRLVILIPSNMYTGPRIESRILEWRKGLKTVRKNRAGVDRPYQSDVYRFTEPINGQFYYIALEGATPMQTFFEAVGSGVTSTWQMKEFQRDILLKFYQSLNRIIKESPDTEKEVELVFYDSKKPDGTTWDVGEYLKDYFEKELSKIHDKIE